MSLTRLKKKTTKGILWLYLLRLLQDRDMYAYEIKNEVMERFGFVTARVTSYVVLYRLEQEGYVKTRWEKRKKYYTITKNGEKLLKDGQEYMKELAERLA